MESERCDMFNLIMIHTNADENFDFDGDNEAEPWQKGIDDEDSLPSNHDSPDQSVISRSDSESRPENGEYDENYNRHENYEDNKKEKVDDVTFKDHDSDAENNSSSDDEMSNRRKENFMSESDDEIATTKDKANSSDLFGDADDISSNDDEEEENNANTSKSPMDSHEGIEQDANIDDHIQPRTSLDGDDNTSGDVTRRDHNDEEHHSGSEEEEAEPPEVRIEADLPKISVNLGDQMHFVKLPNFLSVDPRPFDEQLYEDEVDEEDLMDEEEGFKKICDLQKSQNEIVCNQDKLTDEQSSFRRELASIDAKLSEMANTIDEFDMSVTNVNMQIKGIEGA
ncbi:hypothetical protein HELRODRAFT_172774 [Helobdella robusta]|uniref:Uncharacterized protein n=1 Tax=Helobdella robusta TaxID=6412 RepID=T1F5X4_HELRO|nr:hypothetical protein HELRODRAFT_172774 [Helobdella robusta]ESO04392.1 hypothetical protein HELRODRAFT_172774 [Helobdella robusta]